MLASFDYLKTENSAYSGFHYISLSYEMHRKMSQFFGQRLVIREDHPGRLEVFQMREQQKSPITLPEAGKKAFVLHGSSCPFFAYVHDILHTNDWLF